MAVHPVQPVAGQQAGLLKVLRAGHIAGDHRGHEPLHLGKEGQDQNHPGRKIEEGPGHQDEKPLPGGLVPKGPGVVGVLPLPLHGAEAADGKGPEGIGRLPAPAGKQLRPHADGELVDPDSQRLGGNKVAEFMDGDEQAEHQDGDEDINDGHRTLLIHWADASGAAVALRPRMG